MKKKEKNIVEVHLLSQTQAMTFRDVKNTYTKDGLFCIMLTDGTAIKFPMVNIFRIIDTMP